MANEISLPNSLSKSSILPPEWHQKLTSLYSQPIRAYHTLEHISSLLTLLEEHSVSVYDRDSMEWTIWFHDAIYEPQSSIHGFSEEASIELFQDFIENCPIQTLLPSPTQVQRIITLIRATISHLPPSDLPPGEELADLKLFLDFDLEVLSRAPEDYDRYAVQIRQEYAHYQDSSYRTGRVNVLRKFLARDKIYFTPGEVWQRRENAARQNIQREIKRLEEKMV